MRFSRKLTLILNDRSRPYVFFFCFSLNHKNIALAPVVTRFTSVVETHRWGKVDTSRGTPEFGVPSQRSTKLLDGGLRSGLCCKNSSTQLRHYQHSCGCRENHVRVCSCYIHARSACIARAVGAATTHHKPSLYIQTASRLLSFKEKAMETIVLACCQRSQRIDALLRVKVVPLKRCRAVLHHNFFLKQNWRSRF